MIKSFKHKGLEDFFRHGVKKKINAQQLPRIGRILDALDALDNPQEMNLPGFGLHELTGKRKGTWSVTVSGNWRITFIVSDQNVHDVDLEDYH